MRRTEDNVTAITVDRWQNIPAGGSVPTGFGDEEITAPNGNGTYTLYELADENNQHCGWKWVKTS